MVKKINYLFLVILLSALVVPTETQPFFRSLVSKTTNVFKYGMRGWVGLALCGTFGHYVMRCEHVKEMQETSPLVTDFIREEMAHAGLKSAGTIPIKVDTDQCLIYSPSTPDSEYDSCCHNLFMCNALMESGLKKLLKKQKVDNLTEQEEEKLNMHRYFIRHQARIIANKDHHRLLVARFILPALALYSSRLLQRGANHLLHQTNVDQLLNSNFITFSAKKMGGLLLTVGYELAITLSFLKWYYQRRQRTADGQIDPSHAQPEVLQAGIKHLEELVEKKSSRTNLSDFFVFENARDYEKQADNLRKQLVTYA